ncbi:MAG: 1-phosphofructokinase family hexose kinase [Verrucomicrobia bacterium]|nr:MAG: 1-phosphofructokinase family hexose kinase [Verrucomicrobiota bacterium]
MEQRPLPAAAVDVVHQHRQVHDREVPVLRRRLADAAGPDLAALLPAAATALMDTLVLALNPSIDAEWRVADVLWEEKNNVHSERRWAGGKGINVARWLKHLGGKPQLLVPLGGQIGAELAGYLRAEKISSHIIRLREPTRVNVIVTTNARRQIRFNPLGPELSRRERDNILRVVRRILAALSVRTLKRAEARAPERGVHAASPPECLTPLLILSGSLPRGVPVTAYAQLIRSAHGFGVRTLLDCDGPAFAAAIKARPFLVKPNEHELAQWWGAHAPSRVPADASSAGSLRPEAEILRAARALSAQTRGWVLVSRGGKRGLLVNHAEGFHFTATPPRVKLRNTVGAGDALLAAVARQIQLGKPPEQWLKFGLRIGSKATRLAAGRLS